MSTGNPFYKTTEPILAQLARLTLLALLAAAVCCRAHGGPTIDILLSDDSRYYQQVAEAVINDVRTRHPGTGIILHTLDAAAPWPMSANGSLAITVGTQASIESARRFPHRPQLSLFVTNAVWGDLAKQYDLSNKAAIFIDQPAERILALAKVVAPDAKIYATALGPVSAGNWRNLTKAAQDLDVKLISRSITPDSNPLTVLTPLLKTADLFVALPDNSVINRNVAKWVLHLAFNHKIPVIGFSKAYTDAGGTASLYTSNEDISRQALEWLEDYLDNPEQPEWQTYAPSYFTISVNPAVARNLRLKKTNEEEIHRSVQQLIGKPRP